MNYVGKKRLLKLADYISDVPREKFDMEVVACSNTRSKAPITKETVTEGKCQSAGCAMGHCPVVFPKLTCYVDMGNSFDNKWKWDYDVGLRNSNINDYSGTAQKIFNITEDEAVYLFGPYYSYKVGRRGPKSVAKRIREFVARGGMPKKVS